MLYKKNERFECHPWGKMNFPTGALTLSSTSEARYLRSTLALVAGAERTPSANCRTWVCNRDWG